MSLIVLGLRLYFLAALTISAASKARDLSGLELSLVRLFGTRCFSTASFTSRTAALLLSFYEGLLGVFVAVNPLSPVGAVLLAATMAVFTVVVARAFRMHVSCGCFRSRRPAELSSLTRSSLLFALSIVVAIAEFNRVDTYSDWWSGAGVALGVGVAVGGIVSAVRGLAGQPWPIREVIPTVKLRSLPDDMIIRLGLTDSDGGKAEGWMDVLELSRALRLPVSSVLNSGLGIYSKSAQDPPD
jgi:hypothetical protein